MFKKSWAVINPFDKTAGWILPHVIVGLVLVIAGLLTGVILGPTVKHDIAFFRTHYVANLPAPTTNAPVAYRPHTTASTGSIKISYYPAVGDQDGLGECAGWATAWYLAYDWRIHHTHSWLRFSPRQMYDHYSNTYSGGQDAGSWPDQDAEISSTSGLLQFKALPEPPFVIDHPIPQYDAWGHLTATDAAKHKFNVKFTAISGFSAGGGPGLSQAIMTQIDLGNPVFIAFPVYPEYDNATAQPTILPPTSNEISRGDHSNVILAYDKNHLYPNGTRALAFLIQNQWTTQWGINGRAWMSDAFVQKYVWGVETAKITTTAAKTTSLPPWIAPKGPVHLAPRITSSHPKGNLWYVHNVITHDTRVNVSGLMNYWGDKYGVPPIGLAATAGIESSVNQYSDRCCIPGDTSYGMMQETTGTACSYAGVCSNDAARAYLDNPTNAIRMAAQYYRDAFNYHGNRIGFPNAYGFYNCGPGNSDWFYSDLNQSGACHFQAFLGWWDYAASIYAGPPPKPPVFPGKFYNSYRVSHHESRLPTKGHGADLWWANDKKAGPVISAEQWVKPKHKHGFMTQRFADLRLYWTPKDGHWWQKVRHI